MKKTAKKYSTGTEINKYKAFKLFKGDEMQISLCYSHVIKDLFMVIFYSTLLPIGIPMAILGITVNY